MHAVAISRVGAMALASKFSKPHIIISIQEPKDKLIEFSPNKTRLAVLSIDFYDLDYNPSRWGKKETEEIKKQYGHGIFKPKQARTIINFVEEWKDKIDLIVVHCEAGISRSPGVAAAINKVLTGSDKSIFDNPMYIPNRYIYSTILKEWAKKK